MIKLCRIILLSLCLHSSIALASSWHVIHILKNCNPHIFQSKLVLDSFPLLMVDVLSKKRNDKSCSDQSRNDKSCNDALIKETFFDFGDPIGTYQYDIKMSDKFTVYFMVLGSTLTVLIYIICDENMYDREAMTEMGKSFFRSNDARYICEIV